MPDIKENPFTLDFGRSSSIIIPRTSIMDDLIQLFTSEVSSQQSALITGIRGCGKTVFMTFLSRKLRDLPEWIIADLSPQQDLLQSLIVKLGYDEKVHPVLKEARINLSHFGVRFAIEESEPIPDPETALEKLLEGLRRRQKRLLVTIDDIASNTDIRTFIRTYQLLQCKELPIYLLMTGLYENVRALQDDRHPPFLSQIPQISLGPLNIGAIADSYQQIFHLEQTEALIMARETRGYSFAFQVLGYLCWKYPEDESKVRRMYAQFLEEYVYEKIWADLSPVERNVAAAIARTPDGNVKNIREKARMTTNQFSPYRKRLIRKGLVDENTYGKLRFVLPLFENFVLESTEFSPIYD